mmetsp:Transcript_7450/g.23890  ORF Transcript_7450/g.23890 Transcript_7450/m.23890 type:complete len:230 (+) Transcript_7450:263-952(+)
MHRKRSQHSSAGSAGSAASQLDAKVAAGAQPGRDERPAVEEGAEPAGPDQDPRRGERGVVRSLVEEERLGVLRSCAVCGGAVCACLLIVLGPPVCEEHRNVDRDEDHHRVEACERLRLHRGEAASPLALALRLAVDVHTHRIGRAATSARRTAPLVARAPLLAPRRREGEVRDGGGRDPERDGSHGDALRAGGRVAVGVRHRGEGAVADPSAVGGDEGGGEEGAVRGDV